MLAVEGPLRGGFELFGALGERRRDEHGEAADRRDHEAHDDNDKEKAGPDLHGAALALVLEWTRWGRDWAHPETLPANGVTMLGINWARLRNWPWLSWPRRVRFAAFPMPTVTQFGLRDGELLRVAQLGWRERLAHRP